MAGSGICSLARGSSVPKVVRLRAFHHSTHVRPKASSLQQRPRISPLYTLIARTSTKMAPQSLLRASPRMVNLMGRRMFQTTRARMSSPYHYPEGPYSNLPFNPKTRFFGLRYFLYCFTGFFAPFGIAAWQLYKPKA